MTGAAGLPHRQGAGVNLEELSDSMARRSDGFVRHFEQAGFFSAGGGNVGTAQQQRPRSFSVGEHAHASAPHAVARPEVSDNSGMNATTAQWLTVAIKAMNRKCQPLVRGTVMKPRLG